MALGFSPRPPSTEPSLRPSTSHQLFFSNTQRDAFGLFQAISSQVKIIIIIFSNDSIFRHFVVSSPKMEPCANASLICYSIESNSNRCKTTSAPKLSRRWKGMKKFGYFIILYKFHIRIQY